MIAIKYCLRAEQPLLLTALEGDPNSSVSFEYIPGSMIRGMLISRYLKQYKLHDLLSDETATRLFFSPATRFLNAYIALNNESFERSLPLSRSLRHKKRQKLTDEAWDVSSNGYQNADKNDHKAIKLQFGSINQQQALVLAPSVATVLNVHTTRDRTIGRATRESGAVFQYEALAPNQVFCGVILCDNNNNNDVQTIQDLLNEQIFWLGRSRSAGYGKVRVVNTDIKEDWHEISTQLATGQGSYTVTLLSDAMIRDDSGHYTTTIHNWSPVSISMTTIGGFNRTWRLPLPQVPAIAMGSAFTVAGDIEKLQELQQTGIGERTNEGFGRFAINWLPDVDDKGKIKRVELSGETNGNQSAQAKTQIDLQKMDGIALKVGERIARQWLDTQLPRLVTDYAVHGELTSTQLARLWLTARNNITSQNLDPLKTFVAGLTSNTRQKFERATIHGQSLTHWLEHVDKNSIKFETNDIKSPIQLTNELKLEYTFRLVMAIAKQARKQQQRGENNEH